MRNTPLDDPSYEETLWEAVRIGVEQSPTNYLYSTPWIVVSDPKLKGLNILPSQVRWEGVTFE